MTNNLTSSFIPNNEVDTFLMTVPELAEYLGVGRNRAYELLQSGEIKGFRIGSVWKVTKIAVDKYIYEKSGLL
ncbi:helix-turn-helix domain-containing protein [Sellimonas intestinalis]|uniref:helix-turn-helix domain-containing protein n=1 Tax=Sellimonas intestinalis TaxID=1653434 RepID=UPI0015ECC972|nr:helix-turn-helix domain-containing protein [Sellimonas intestinalis]MBA2214188.1 helix-turn-helix domain-containing protein [Sellimonas intestinalis]